MTTDLFSLDTAVDPHDEQGPQPLGKWLLDTTDQPGPFVVVHTLTTVTDVNPNRDFEGMPKNTTYGGADRLRISSQSRLRAARVWSRNYLASTSQAARTRSLPGAVRKLLVEQYDHDPAAAGYTAAALIASTGMGIDWARPDLTTAVMFVPSEAARGLAELAHREWDALAAARDAAREAIDAALNVTKKKAGAKKGKKDDTVAEAAEPVSDAAAEPGKDKKDEETKFKTSLVPSALSKQALAAFDPAANIDVALYGRMLANIPSGTVDSAVQVAHSFSVDALSEIFDEYTVVDDWQGDDVFGSANMGRQYLASGTLYGYAALDRRQLRATLAGAGGDAEDAEDVEAAARLAEQVFVAAMAWSMPSGKRTRTGSSVMPTLVVAATTDWPLTAGPAFEIPVEAPAGITGADRLCAYLDQLDRRATLIGGRASWISPNGSRAPELPGTIVLD